MSSGRCTEVTYYLLEKININEIYLFLFGLSWTGFVTVVISAEVDRCQPDPCANGATCISQDNIYICICPPKFQGRNCDKGNASNYICTEGQELYNKTLNSTIGVLTEILPPTFYGCLYKNGGCEHFCTEAEDSVHQCHCATGYSLAADNRSCVSQGGLWHYQNGDMTYKSHQIKYTTRKIRMFSSDILKIT